YEARGAGAERVDRERPSPVRPRACRYAGQLAPTRSPPVAHHAGLREREGAEDPDDVELDQALDVGAERDHERDGRRGEDDGAVGVDEPVAQVAELARQEAIAREQAGQPREALERAGGGGEEDGEGEQ